MESGGIGLEQVDPQLHSVKPNTRNPGPKTFKPGIEYPPNGHSTQGNLAQKKTPPPPKGHRHSPTVGS